MVSKFKRIIIIITGVILLGWIANFYGRKHIGNLGDVWSDEYEKRHDVDARKAAENMGYIHAFSNAYYLGQLAVTDSIHLKSRARQVVLSEALNRMEWVKFSFPVGADWRPFILLKASISALLGDKRKAAQYANEGCNLKRPRTIEECVIGKYGFANPADEPFGNRFSAISLYEDTALYNAIGTGDKTQSTFYQAVALKYFDIDKARAILNQLSREGRLTPEMQKIYCNPASPKDATVCKTQ